MTEPKAENSELLTAEFAWLSALIKYRLELHAAGETGGDLLAALPPPDIAHNEGPYAVFLRAFECTEADRVYLALSLAPIIAPQLLDSFLIINQAINRRFTEFGGRANSDSTVFVPTLQTAMFCLAGGNISMTLNHLQAFEDSPLVGQADAFEFDETLENRLALDQALVLTQETREHLLWGNDYLPPFSSAFPAERLTSKLDWNDLVLPDDVLDEVAQILTWLNKGEALMQDWQLSKRVAPGFRALFAGPPGTGKSLTAALLGKATGRLVFRVDLSRVVSKYIGETEKNLARLFDRAQNRDWILFFDEADALFGRRGDGSNAGDRAANQNVSYLLQRIETFPGVVILASNLRENIDEAFSRRFQSMVNFKMPDATARVRLWRDSFVDKSFAVSEAIDWQHVAREYEVSGGQIVNILRFCCMQAIVREGGEVRKEDILLGIQRELRKNIG